MGKPHPIELRERVVKFVEEGHTHRAAAAHFRVSVRFVNDMVILKRETGSLAPKRQGHGRTVITRSAMTQPPSRICSSICSWRPTQSRPSGLSLILMPPMMRSTGTRRVGSFMATMIATATCRCTFSVAGTCWWPSSGAPTSTVRPVPARRSSASSPTSARGGRVCVSCCALIQVLLVKN